MTAFKVMTQNRLGEGMLYTVDPSTGIVSFDRSFSQYGWNDACEQRPSADPATDENPDGRSDFQPVVAVTQGYCPGVGMCIFRVTDAGQLEYEALTV